MNQTRKRISLFALLAILLLGYQSTATADGFYFGGGVYLSQAKFDGLDETDEVPAAFLGYKFIDSNVFMLSAELGYYDLGEFSKDGLDIEADTLTIGAVAALPLGPFIELYAKAGVGETNVTINDEDSEDNEAYLGAGIALDIWDTVDIYIEYLDFDTEIDSNMVGAGILIDLF